MRQGSGLVLISVVMSHHCENEEGVDVENGIE